ncbi:MAG: hypothetical protein EOM28_03200 [Clostridia bacterium]|nr:hypothetical protein [Clostridia bacterium]
MGYARDMINQNDNQALIENQNKLKQELKEHQNSDKCTGENCSECSRLQMAIDAAEPTLP